MIPKITCKKRTFSVEEIIRFFFFLHRSNNNPSLQPTELFIHRNIKNKLTSDSRPRLFSSLWTSSVLTIRLREDSTSADVGWAEPKNLWQGSFLQRGAIKDDDGGEAKEVLIDNALATAALLPPRRTNPRTTIIEGETTIFLWIVSRREKKIRQTLRRRSGMPKKIRTARDKSFNDYCLRVTWFSKAVVPSVVAKVTCYLYERGSPLATAVVCKKEELQLK